ncbi:hypothetical protein LSAT2_023919 [Lamellibrachia satsuma]|nr:hypothetical protein LSAT2_023919 [Lamellibrachia satsuma]
MVRMNRSVRQLIEGNTPVAPAQSVRAPPGSTLLSSVGFSYVVRRVQESTVKETNPLLSDAHIHYAMKRVGMTDTVNPNSVVNPHPFNYIINNENLCGADLGSDVFILVYVHSAPENTARRALIRATWGNRKHYFPRKMRLIFVLGK